jgi:hypothetical protein
LDRFQVEYTTDGVAKSLGQVTLSESLVFRGGETVLNLPYGRRAKGVVEQAFKPGRDTAELIDNLLCPHEILLFALR